MHQHGIHDPLFPVSGFQFLQNSQFLVSIVYIVLQFLVFSLLLYMFLQTVSSRSYSLVFIVFLVSSLYLIQYDNLDSIYIVYSFQFLVNLCRFQFLVSSFQSFQFLVFLVSSFLTCTMQFPPWFLAFRFQFLVSSFQVIIYRISRFQYFPVFLVPRFEILVSSGRGFQFLVSSFYYIDLVIICNLVFICSTAFSLSLSLFLSLSLSFSLSLSLFLSICKYIFHMQGYVCPL